MKSKKEDKFLSDYLRKRPKTARIVYDALSEKIPDSDIQFELASISDLPRYREIKKFIAWFVGSYNKLIKDYDSSAKAKAHQSGIVYDLALIYLMKTGRAKVHPSMMLGA